MPGIIDSIQLIISDNHNRFIEKASEEMEKRYDIPRDEAKAFCFEIWKEVQSSYPTIRSPRNLFRGTKTSPRKGKVTGYILFGKEKREKIRANNPDLSFGDISKELSGMWKKLSNEEKAKYSQLALEHNKKIDEEKEEESSEDERIKKARSILPLKIPDKIFKKSGCSFIIKSGVRKGLQCSNPVSGESHLCKRHLEKASSSPDKIEKEGIQV